MLTKELTAGNAAGNSGQGLAAYQKPRTLEAVAAEIRTFTAGMLNNIIEIGRRMVEAKEMLPHGEFGTWIHENTGYSASTAQNFMRLYLEYGDMQGNLFGAEVKAQTFGHLTYSKALALLAVPSEEREAFVREKSVEDMSVRELKEAIRERDEARRELEAEKQASEGLAVRLSQMEFSLSATDAALDGAREAAEQAQADAAAAEERRRKMEEDLRFLKETHAGTLEELEELRNRPVEVAVQTVVDEEAVKAAREETRKELAATVEQHDAKRIAAEREADTVRASLREQTDHLRELEGQLQEARDELKKARETAARAAVQAAASERAGGRAEKDGGSKDAGSDGGKELALFELLFGQAQGTVNQLHGILLKVRERDADLAGKLQKALVALSDAVREVAS